MLTLTENAQTLVREITSRPEVPADGGLRIAPSPTEGELQMTLAEGPEPGDQVIGPDDARVFVDPTAAQVLDTSTLDADGASASAGAGFIIRQA